MELWIRGQEKDILSRVNTLAIDDDKPIIFCQFEKTKIILGKYETKERALEVLDEIQKTMSKTLDCIIEQSDNCVVGCNTLVIYKMPKE